ncbi:MAG: hypothetical protein ABSA53_14345 [Streptosporangiaceae bacterium]|jgi:hypothetical protein
MITLPYLAALDYLSQLPGPVQPPRLNGGVGVAELVKFQAIAAAGDGVLP